MRSIIILTGSELRHTFMRKAIAISGACVVARSFCEGLEQSLDSHINKSDIDENCLRRNHATARFNSESDFFSQFIRFTPDRSNPVFIEKGAINAPPYPQDIIDISPDLIVAYGCSLIRSPLISYFPRRFINVHLGLSPYFRGSGTNFFALVDGAPEYVGATFMFLDEGIDTGEIIHQIRARVFPEDTPHQIGNRLIGDVAVIYSELIRRFDLLEPMPQPTPPAEVRVCKRKDFTEAATAKLYEQFSNGMIEQYLKELEPRCASVPIVRNPALEDVVL